MNRTIAILTALGVSLVATSTVTADEHKAGPRDTVSIERPDVAAARYAALEIDPADLAATGAKPARACVVRRAGPRDSVRIGKRC